MNILQSLTYFGLWILIFECYLTRWPNPGVCWILIAPPSGAVIVMNTHVPVSKPNSSIYDQMLSQAATARKAIECFMPSWRFEVSEDCLIAYRVSRVLELVEVSGSTKMFMSQPIKKLNSSTNEALKWGLQVLYLTSKDDHKDRGQKVWLDLEA